MALKGNAQVMSEHLASFDQVIATKVKNAREETQKLDQTIANLEKALQEAPTKPTKALGKDGNPSPHQRCRSTCDAIRNVPDLKKSLRTWQKYGDEYHRAVKDGATREQELMQKHIGTVWRLLRTSKADDEKECLGHGLSEWRGPAMRPWPRGSGRYGSGRKADWRCLQRLWWRIVPHMDGVAKRTGGRLRKPVLPILHPPPVGDVFQTRRH